VAKILMIFPRVHYAFAEFVGGGGVRRFGPPLNTPLVSRIRLSCEQTITPGTTAVSCPSHCLGRDIRWQINTTWSVLTERCET